MNPDMKTDIKKIARRILKENRPIFDRLAKEEDA